MKDKLLKLCDGCADDLRAAGFAAVEVVGMLPQIGQCDVCKAQRRMGYKALRVYGVGKLPVDKPVESLVKSQAVTALQRF